MTGMERVSRGMRTLLIVSAPFLWVVAIGLGIIDIDGRGIAYILGLAAAVGTLCGQMRERDEATIAQLGRELAEATLPAPYQEEDGPRLRGLPGGQ